MTKAIGSMTPLPDIERLCTKEEGSSTSPKPVINYEPGVSNDVEVLNVRDSVYMQNTVLSNEQELVGNEIDVKSAETSRNTCYECASCRTKVQSKSKLICHFKEKHNFLEDCGSNIRAEIHKCDVCNKIYTHKSSLMKHNKLKHNLSVEKTFKCAECPSMFNCVYNLNAHRKKKHPKEESNSEEEIVYETLSGDKVVVKKNKKKSFLCKMCGKKFSHLSGLSYHKKKKHGSVVDRPYECSQCDAKYAMKRSLHQHLRKMHGLGPSRQSKFSKPSIKCVLCSTTFVTSSLLCQHYTHSHQVNIESENLEFSSYSLFQNWKHNFERETNEKFILERGCQISKAKTKKFRFLCHRSGHFVRKGSIRKLKNQGSKKMNAHCPAMMTVSEFASGICKVYLLKTHVGHTADLCHIFLTPSDRRKIADQIASKVSFDEILDNIRQSVDGMPSERLHLLKRKDLHNIEKEFSLAGETEKLQNDAVSIHSWVNSVSNQADPCVLFYKPLGQTLDIPNTTLKDDDFILILMNSSQSQLLLKYGKDKIVLDGTYTSDSDFQLITILVIDDVGHSFPAAFLVSNRINVDILLFLFHQIKSKVGTLVPNILMYDIDEQYYFAWAEVMGQPSSRFWSPWQVDASWRKNIKRKISSNNKRAEVYKTLRVLYQEATTDSFSKTLNKFVENLSLDLSLEEFRSYFSQFVNNVEQWASCFRVKYGIIIDTHMERMHRTLRHIFVKGRRLKELDKVIIALIKLVHDKLYHGDLILQKGNVNAKISIIKNRHRKSLSLLANTVIESPKGWQVPSSVDDYSELCFVSRNPKKQVCACKLVCDDCQACIHIYHCECIDSSILGNMCEHIHLVCRYLQHSEPAQPAQTLNTVERLNPIDQLSTVVEMPPVAQLNEVEPMIPVDQITSVESHINSHTISTLQSVDTVPNLMAVDSYEIYVLPELSSELPSLMQRKENVITLFLEAVNSVSSYEDMDLIERATSDLVSSLATVNSYSAQIN
ncbi:uncharacterized protein [Bemisia tabaci]|uniref:uncharacterized protein n=1 Tax=Bemisia tabaci TaxID=7038 RepID=UPI003B289F07